MKTVSATYKEHIKDTLRDRGYARIIVGDTPNWFSFNSSVVYPSSHDDASVSHDMTYNFTYYSNPDIIMNTNGERDVYATLEDHHTKVDGSMRFVPRLNGEEPIFSRGLTSKDLTTPVKVGFACSNATQNQPITSFEIQFGENYPRSFYIRFSSPTVQPYVYVNNNYSSKVKVQTNFGVTSSSVNICIGITDKAYSNGRIRIYSVGLNGGECLTNNELLNCSIHSTMSEVSAILPQSELEFSIWDTSDNFRLDNPNFDIDRFRGKRAAVAFGYTLPNNIIEWIAYTDHRITGLSKKGNTVTFSGIDEISFIDKKYYKAKIPNSSYDYGDLLAEVVYDLYNVGAVAIYDPDGCVNTTRLYNPAPLATCREILQMISNARQCTISLDKKYIALLNNNYQVDINVKQITNTAVDFTIGKSDMLSEPIIRDTGKISYIDVAYTLYTPVDTDKTTKIIDDHNSRFISDQTKTYTWTTPYVSVTPYRPSGYTISWTAYLYSVEMKPSGSYTYDFYANATGEYEISKPVVTVKVNDGELNTVTWDNPLIGDSLEATNLGNLMRSYFSQSLEYEYDTRGFPELEVGDVIYQENDFVQNMKVRITELTINFDGAFSGHMKVKRV